MKPLITILTLVIASIALTQCVKPFETSSFDYEKVIVVDGLITDEMKSHIVTLNYNFPIGESEELPLTDASVWIEGSNIGRIDFIESQPGTYRSNISFSGTTTETYQLFFTTTDGEMFESSKSSLIKSPPIDSIYDKYVEITTEESTSNLAGIQFFLDTSDDTNNAKFFRYEWEDTYKIVTPFTSYFEYFPTTLSYGRRDTLLNICYLGTNSKSLLIGNTVGSSAHRLVEFPIRFVRGDIEILRNRYSILVKQYAISASAYSYYRKLKESNESGGSLFDKQQGTILGNISSSSNPELSVQGYFEVSGVSELRAFFSYDDLDDRLPLPKYRYSCPDDFILRTTEDSVSIYMSTKRFLQIGNVNARDNEATLGPASCMDCTSYASIIKPDFWID